jgi:hypothetical protein
MSRSAILLKVGLVNFIFFQLRNEGIHNIVTVLLEAEILREKSCPTLRLRDIPIQTPIFSSCSGDSLSSDAQRRFDLPVYMEGQAIEI